tara:strand:+ start:721 stop:1494 length:774 start_codon:yes stop_codon:yes gene_type:complete
MEINKIYNENCLETMKRMENNFVDVVLTSPPYNMTKRNGGYADKGKRYDIYKDWKSEKEYILWSLDIFNNINNVLNKNGVILYNFSYSIENPSLPYMMVSEIIKNTNFVIADTIIWKKNNSVPHPASYNRLNRVVEFIFVFCRGDEIKDFNCYKKKIKTSTSGQKYYEIIDNLIKAKNNDEPNEINKATFSSILCRKLLKIYSKKGDLIYDPFMGSGTTAKAAHLLDRNWIGSEISEKQVEYANKRLVKYLTQTKLF